MPHKRETEMTPNKTEELSFIREGVRALLVDKDNTPSWSPPRIEDVDPAAVRAMFAG